MEGEEEGGGGVMVVATLSAVSPPTQFHLDST